VFLKEEKVCYKMVYYTRNRVAKLEFKQAKKGLYREGLGT